MTNGVLFDEKIWAQLEGKYKNISIGISIDATTEDTYNKLRKGNFSKLMSNMAFLSELRKQDKVQNVTVNMIVQRDNYKEMKDFVIWGKEMGFDRVYLSNIWNWGTFSHEEFQKISMFYPDGKMKPELQEILNDPIFDDPIVDKRWQGRE